MSRPIPVRFLDGPLAGVERLLDRDLVAYGYRHPIEQPDPGLLRIGDHAFPPASDLLVVEYRTVSRLEVHDLPGLPLDTVLAEMRMMKPPQVAAVERLLNEWRALYGMPTIGFGS